MLPTVILFGPGSHAPFGPGPWEKYILYNDVHSLSQFMTKASFLLQH